MKLTSSAFDNNSIIPKKYGYKHGNISPPLKFEDIPEGTKSLVLIIDDPDAMEAVGKVWSHWIIWNISPNISEFPENSIPENCLEGKTDFGEIGYGGPAPPDKEHRYVFKLYAIKSILPNPKGSSKQEIENSIQNQILEKTELYGKFSPQ